MILICAAPPILLFMLYWAASVASSRGVSHRWWIFFCALLPAIVMIILLGLHTLSPDFNLPVDPSLLMICTPIANIVAIIWAYADERRVY